MAQSPIERTGTTLSPEGLSRAVIILPLRRLLAAMLLLALPGCPPGDSAKTVPAPRHTPTPTALDSPSPSPAPPAVTAREARPAAGADLAPGPQALSLPRIVTVPDCVPIQDQVIIVGNAEFRRPPPRGTSLVMGEPWLARSDTSGVLVSLSWLERGHVTCCTEDPGGAVAAVGDGWFARFDQDGRVAAEAPLGGGATSIAPLGSRAFVVWSRTHFERLQALSPSGERLWSRTTEELFGPFRGGDVQDRERVFCSAALRTPGGTLLVGSRGSFSYARPWLGEVDTDGRCLWQITDSEAPVGGAELVNVAACESGFVIASHGHEADGHRTVQVVVVQQRDERGGVVWTTRVGLARAKALAVTDDGTILVGGLVRDTAQDGVLLRLDPSGHVLDRIDLKARHIARLVPIRGTRAAFGVLYVPGPGGYCFERVGG